LRSTQDAHILYYNFKRITLRRRLSKKCREVNLSKKDYPTQHIYLTYFKDLALEKLLGPGIAPEDFNEDTVGRTLDRITD
jgi:hypothetical protein